MTTLLLPASRFFLNVSNNAMQMNPSERYRLFPGKLTVSYQLSLIFRSMDQTHFPKALILSGGNVEESKLNGRDSIICLAVRNQSIAQPSQKIQGKIRTRKPLLSEGRDEDERFGDICPGCGVFLQNKDSNLPGYFQKRKVELKELSENEEDGEGDIEAFEEVNEDEDEFTDEDELGSDDEYEESDLEEGPLKMDDEFKWDSDEWEAKLMEEEKFDPELAGFAPAGLGYGNITEESLKKARKKVSKSEKKRILRESQKEKEEVTVCARCHSLRNYGQVKNQTAENLIPDFDFDRLIVSRLIKPTVNANTTVVVMVVDCVDFDGSFPKQAVKSLFKALEGAKNDSKHSKNLPKLVLVATKVDLLPSQIPPTRLDKWVRHRAKAGGAPKLSGVYLVSARKDLGVRNLLSFIKELAGPRGNVWVIGAQNAGKSTLINAFAKKEGARVSKLTEAPIPGTTLGILRIEGILSAKSKLYDTPGLLHPYLVSLRLNREEQKMVEIRKELQPRTYRMKVGQAVHVGGLMRLDLSEASVDTIYVTVWASPNVSLHLGKIENADEIMRKHAGIRLQWAYSELKMYENLVGGWLFIVDDMLENKIFVELQPPIGIDRAGEMDSWEEREFKVSGSSWTVNSIDIAAAGLGWLSLGLKGEASVRLWIYDGIEISLREPLVLDRAPFLERPGFLLPKAISNAIASGSKLEAGKPKNVHEEIIDSLSDLPV